MTLRRLQLMIMRNQPTGGLCRILIKALSQLVFFLDHALNIKTLIFGPLIEPTIAVGQIAVKHPSKIGGQLPQPRLLLQLITV